MADDKTNKRINWRDVIGNPFLNSLHPSMLLGEFILTGYRKVKGTGYKNGAKEWVEVIYDKDYVIEWLFVQVMQKLRPNSYVAFIELVNIAWSKYQSDAKKKSD